MLKDKRDLEAEIDILNDRIFQMSIRISELEEKMDTQKVILNAKMDLIVSLLRGDKKEGE